MKPSRIARPRSRADRSVVRWSTLLLIALGAVFTALFLSARLLLSLANEPGIEQTSVRGTLQDAIIVANARRPNGSESRSTL